MKKLKYLTLIFILILVGCTKEALTTSEFKEIVRDNGYKVVSVKEQFSEYDYIKTAYLAEKDNYQIEFYITSDEKNGIAFYDLNKSILQASETTDTKIKETDTKYTLETEDEYMVISRIDNTIIYVDVDIKYKDDIKNILNKLGY